MTAWAIPADARTWWRDAADLSDNELQFLLGAAQEECEAFAPALADTDPVPARYTLAVVYQARDIYAVSRRQGDSDLIGDGEYAIRARPLSGAIKQLLRPLGGRPRFGRQATTTTTTP